ncbi:hypothetical protein GUJ93_ZPchr0007g5614 [Zizania palustris]|uniref:Uncharacterized protein n=1 Tax=Zizania palustris TaxID=103762 RepID=A0A8J5VNI5_ZIZPA|nr:hypothetical protein GUJ93_ZPchr0007g5614 [Zizania palustris]
MRTNTSDSDGFAASKTRTCRSFAALMAIGKKAGAARGPAARPGRQERKAGISAVDPEDKAKLDLDPEFLPPISHLS